MGFKGTIKDHIITHGPMIYDMATHLELTYS